MGDLGKGSLHCVGPISEARVQKWQSAEASSYPGDGGLAEGGGKECQKPAAGQK